MKCRSCNAPIDFVKTPKGRNVPVDPTYVKIMANPKGDTVVVTDSGQVIRGTRQKPEATQYVTEGRVSHFATCPNASSHRRAKLSPKPCAGRRARAVADTGLALTLWQPWASAIVVGPKRVENRPWPPPDAVVGTRIYIHAGKTYDHARAPRVAALWPFIGDGENLFPRGAIIGSARVIGAGYFEGGFGKAEIRGAATESIFSDPWWMGPFGWLLDDVRTLAEPVPCRGLQKLWRVPVDVLERCRAQEAARG